jgi:hypothetical protein
VQYWRPIAPPEECKPWAGYVGEYVRHDLCSEHRIVLAVAGDHGGAAALVPVLQMMMADGLVDVHALAYGQACAVWQRKGLKFEPLPKSLGDSDIRSYLAGARLLLVGTSCNGLDYERAFVVAAWQRGCASLAVLDFWSNYASRFRGPGGDLVLPSRIAVMDQRATEEMMAAGIPGGILTVTGQPAFDDLAGVRVGFTLSRRDEIRAHFGANRTDALVLFASQPLRQFNAALGPTADQPGYDETLVLPAVAAALVRISGRRHRVVRLLVRPHPREDAAGLQRLVDGIKGLDAVVSADCDPREVVMASDLVCGMTTILLVESCYLGVPAVSVQPGLDGRDPLPTNQMEISLGVYEEGMIEPAVESLLFDPATRDSCMRRLNNFRPNGGATSRVTDLIYKMIN